MAVADPVARALRILTRDEDVPEPPADLPELPPAWAYADEPAAEQAGARAKPQPEQPAAGAITLRHVSEIVAERREPRWLLHKVLERRVLAVIAGPRGTFKSFIALHWGMLAARDGHTVVMLSAEGAGLDRRVDAWCRAHDSKLDLGKLPLLALERPVNLTASATLIELSAAIRASAPNVALIVVDTFSKYAPGLDENDNAEVAAFLSLLATGLRDEFDCTVLVVAHSGHGDAKRPRGASVLMANPDAEYIVERPDAQAMTVTVSRERFKDCPSLPALAYMADTVDLGRVDSYGEAVTSLALREADAPQVKPRASGANQQAAVVALREWGRAHPEAEHIASTDMAAILKGQGIGAKRKPEVLNWLVNAGILTPSVAGHRLNREVL